MPSRRIPLTQRLSITTLILFSVILELRAEEDYTKLTYNQAKVEWQKNQCIYPDSSLYLDIPGTLFNPSFFGQCESADSKPAVTDAEFFTKEVCKSVYFVSLTFCTSTGTKSFVAKELPKTFLDKAWDFSHVDVCGYADVLSKDPRTKSVIHFNLTKDCDKFCTNDLKLKPVCELLVSGLCQYFKTCKVEHVKPAATGPVVSTGSEDGSKDDKSASPKPVDGGGKEETPAGPKPADSASSANPPPSAVSDSSHKPAPLVTAATGQSGLKEGIPSVNSSTTIAPVVGNTRAPGVGGAGVGNTSAPGVGGAGVGNTSTPGVGGAGVGNTSAPGVGGAGVGNTSAPGVGGTGVGTPSKPGVSPVVGDSGVIIPSAALAATSDPPRVIGAASTASQTKLDTTSTPKPPQGNNDQKTDAPIAPVGIDDQNQSVDMGVGPGVDQDNNWLAPQPAGLPTDNQLVQGNEIIPPVVNENTHSKDEDYGDLTGKAPSGYQTVEENVPGSGHFFAYFLTAVVICISGYVIFHNKKKILAFIVEGRSGAEGGRRRGTGDVQYKPLQSNVEEVMPSLDKATTAKNFVY